MTIDLSRRFNIGIYPILCRYPRDNSIFHLTMDKMNNFEYTPIIIDEDKTKLVIC